MELTILMPCLNEAETLATCIVKARQFLDENQVSGEVLIADNGSTDGSIDIALASGARVTHVAKRGYGAALIQGMHDAKGQFVIMGDADDSYDFSSLHLFLQHLRAGNELVMGNRFKGGIAKGAMPFLHRYLGNPVLSFLGRLFFNVPIGDFHCGLRGFDRARMLSLNLTSSGMEFASEMIVKSRLHDVRISEVPTTLAVDGRSRAPHLKTWSDGWRHLKFLLLHSPRWLFLYPGLLCMLIGLLMMIGLSGGPIEVTPQVHLDIHSLVIGCVLALVGMQATSFALVARSYAATSGMLPTSMTMQQWLQILSMERLLIIALLLFAGGMAGMLSGVWTWVEQGLGDLEYASLLRPLLVSGTAVVVSLQLVFTAFLRELVINPVHRP